MSSRLDKKKTLYMEWWDNIGRRLKKILLLLLFMTFIIQSIMALDSGLLPMNETLKLEGEAVIENYHYEERGIIRIIAENRKDISQIKAYINGELIRTGDSESIDLNVRNNDIIEIDGTESDKNINIIIEDTSENVVFPKESMRYNIKGNIVIIGRVKLK